ncbi:MAG: Rho termination factor N-terminal domain-containing protein, partial [Deltaproteobacteria bacterium]|nr:Rho termination factor N-terminal domain-containing protein [Deltaproteobacteria bacterium]
MDPRTLAALPLAELRRLAAARHLKGRSRMKREDLVAVLSVREPSDPTASRPAAKKAPRVAAKKAPR